MKIYLGFLTIVAVIIANTVLGQDNLYSGGWTTSNANRLTAISCGSGVSARLYKIECISLVDADILQFNVLVDGVTLPASFFEGGSVTVEGKNIFIQQTGNGKMIKGNWKAIQQPEIAAEKVSWVGYPSLNREILVASFNTEKEFVISINATSSGCVNIAMQIFIDGNPVKDANNNIISFAEGSSVYSKGRKVTIKVTGTCGNVNTINGDIKIVK